MGIGDRAIQNEAPPAPGRQAQGFSEQGAMHAASKPLGALGSKPP